MTKRAKPVKPVTPANPDEAPAKVDLNAATVDQLQAIKGIGPFYSALIVIRGSGLADVLPVNEPKLLALAATLYGRPAPPSEAEFQAMAEPWRPFRTWAAVLIRAAGPRLLT